MTFRVVHTTRYRYSQPVTLCHNEAHLRPRTCPGQVCRDSRVEIQPLPALWHERTDFFGNAVTYFAVEEPHELLSVTATSVVDVQPPAVRQLDASCAWDTVAAQLMTDIGPTALSARQMILDSPMVTASAELVAYAQPSFPPGRPLLAAVFDLSQRIHRGFSYDPATTTVATPLTEVLAQQRGVCQDFAHLAIGCLRSLGVPARYVSGYLQSVPPPGQPRLQGADMSHAWFAVFEPALGWVDFDPTNDQIVNDQHVTTAWGRDYSDVTPLKGVIFGGGTHTLEVAVDMTPDGSEPNQQAVIGNQ